MRVIGAGFGRTGTRSTQAALVRLGLGPCHHMFELIMEDRTVDAFAAAGRGETVDWRAAMDGYGSCIDWPACNFHAELAEAFPDAKILLSVRDPERWYDSVASTIHRAWLGSKDGDGPITGAKLDVIRDVVWGERGTFQGRFEDREWVLSMLAERTAAVQAAYPADRLLTFDASEGWEPLCAFLDVPVPDEPFPRLNDREQFAEVFGTGDLEG